MNQWFYEHVPKIWGRWWSARLLATTVCATWLHEGNQDFTRWQRLKRNALCLLLFLLPGKLPLAINKQPSSESSELITEKSASIDNSLK